jgi:hypothetical protein
LTQGDRGKNLLIAQGLSATLFDDMAALTGFEQTLESTRAGRRDHTGASADLGRIATEIGEQGASNSARKTCHPEPTALQRARSRSEEFMREAKDLKASRLRACGG